jgi:hypothetical protein
MKPATAAILIPIELFIVNPLEGLWSKLTAGCAPKFLAGAQKLRVI